jgi:DNA helicase IV
MFKKIIDYYHRNSKNVRYLETYSKLLSKIQNDYYRLFFDDNNYIDPLVINEWNNQLKELKDLKLIKLLNRFPYRFTFKKVQKKKERLEFDIEQLSDTISRHNHYVARKKIDRAYELIGKIENIYLDAQQMECVVKDVTNQLVIAGAGTGKTTTVIGKIKYLLKTNEYSSNQVLALSYTHASADDMSERISKEIGQDITAWTFHKLGLDIIKKSVNERPKITELNLFKFIKSSINEKINDKKYLSLLNSYVMSTRVIARNEFEFTSQNEYDEYLRSNPPTTLKSERVKSYGEMDIANFLYQNGIDYIYEYSYPKPDFETEPFRYKPDFFLPNDEIYIEYFGINREGKVPSYFKANGTISASDDYQSKMQWKKELHSRNNTILIESFSYEKFENILIDNLKDSLEKNGVTLTLKTPEEIWKELAGDGETILDGIVETMVTAINLIKSNHYTINDLRVLNQGHRSSESNAIFISLIEPIYQEYQEYLELNNEIDFNDMINLATQYIKEGKFTNPFRFVIVDEYQDISKSRFLLLKALRESSHFKLLCVGDDWQSIYRFTGSDVGLILDFDKHWGPSSIDMIETTYRFNHSLIRVSGGFIMKNPSQFKKNLKHTSNNNGFALSEVNGYKIQYSLDFLCHKLKELPRNSSVFFIGRYRHDHKLIENEELSYQYNNQASKIEVFMKSRRDLKMEFITAHASKGLQADYVVIVNNKDDVLGFPSKVSNPPILELLLHKAEDFPHSEERRLFYVALTRARKKSILLTIKDKESVFVDELKHEYGHELSQEKYECPLCGGRIVRKSGPRGDFYGCTNYWAIDCRYTRNIV